MLISILSLPEFTIIYGVACISCHFNTQGSGLRNENGWGQMQIYLPIYNKKKEDLIEYKINNSIFYGSDIRIFYLRIRDSSYIFPMQTDFYINYKPTSSIDIYAKLGLRGLYEAFAVLWNIFFLNTYIKGGLFLPNYGLRYEDHTYFTRDYLDNRIIDRYFNRFETGGFEIGYAYETYQISFSIMNSWGNFPLFLPENQVITTNNFKIFHLKERYNALLGLTGIYKDENNYVFGGYGGFGLSNGISALSEYSRYPDFNVLTTILRYIFKRGIHVVLSYDFSSENNQSRIGGGISLFYIPNLEITTRYYYYFNSFDFLAFSLHFGF
jgi:hypothetical protein